MTEFDDLVNAYAAEPPGDEPAGPGGALSAAYADLITDHLDRYVGGLTTAVPTTGPVDVWAGIRRMAQAIEERDRLAEEYWRAHWRGRLDGATLTDVMRLRHRGELPYVCHLAAGPDARQRILQRFAAQAAVAGGRWRPVGLAEHRLTGLDIIVDPALGGYWELRTGQPGGQSAAPPPEVIASGRRLA